MIRPSPAECPFCRGSVLGVAVLDQQPDRPRELAVKRDGAIVMQCPVCVRPIQMGAGDPPQAAAGADADDGG